MAFVDDVHQHQESAAELSNAYNIDFSVGAGARGNLPDDIVLVQALLRIVHFEVSDPLPPPPGETGIAVDGILGPKTIRVHPESSSGWPRRKAIPRPARRRASIRSAGKASSPPSRRPSTRWRLLNNTAFGCAAREGLANYQALPQRDDIPPEPGRRAARPAAHRRAQVRARARVLKPAGARHAGDRFPPIPQRRPRATSSCT